MRYVLGTILSIGLLYGACFGAENVELKDQKDKESYSLGYQYGQNMKAQGVSLNLDVYTSGIKDALAGTKPLLSQEEINKTVLEFQQRIVARRQKELKEKGEKNLSEGKRFMEANKKKEGVKTLPSGVQYKVLTAGSGKTPKATDEVTVQYRGSFIDGTEFDSSYKRGKPLTLQLDNVIPGWKEPLLLMQEGAKWQLFVPPESAYGDQGMGAIPPNATLIFEVELVSVK